jgi:hypothetical protein
LNATATRAKVETMVRDLIPLIDANIVCSYVGPESTRSNELDLANLAYSHSVCRARTIHNGSLFGRCSRGSRAWANVTTLKRPGASSAALSREVIADLSAWCRSIAMIGRRLKRLWLGSLRSGHHAASSATPT